MFKFRKSFMKPFSNILLTFAVMTFATCAQAQNIEVSNAWIRSTVPGQKGTGAYMKIIARDGAVLVGVSSPVAGVSEMHEMKMEGDVMKMRALPSLDLPAGKAVELRPGGYHFMLMDLKQTLAKDTKVPLILVFKDAKGAESKMTLKVPVSMVAPDGMTGKMPAHKH